MSASFPPRVGRVSEGLFVGPEVDWRGPRLCRCVLLVNVVKSLSDVIDMVEPTITLGQVQITSINYRIDARLRILTMVICVTDIS